MMMTMMIYPDHLILLNCMRIYLTLRNTKVYHCQHKSLL